MSLKQKVQGKIEISRIFGGDEAKPIRIRVTDKSSGCIAFEADVALDDFTRAITGESYIPVDYFVYQSPVIGATAEHKQEVVARPKTSMRSKGEAEAKQIAKAYEVDGWLASISDFFNSHRWVGTDKVSVTFHRFVKNGKPLLRDEEGNICHVR